MADEKYVPLELFMTTVKVLCSQITDLTVSVLVLRAALMQSHRLPIPVEELMRLDALAGERPGIRSAREAIARLDVNTTEALSQLLKNFEGPIQ
jgi:hypothetical protein